MYSTPQKLIAEFLGTFALIFFGAGSICTDQYLHGAGGLGLLGIALAHVWPSALWFPRSATSPVDISIRRDHRLWGHQACEHCGHHSLLGRAACRATAAAFLLRAVVPEETWRAVALGTPELARIFRARRHGP